MFLLILVLTAQGPINAPFTIVEYGDYECPYTGMDMAGNSINQTFNDKEFLTISFISTQLNQRLRGEIVR